MSSEQLQPILDAAEIGERTRTLIAAATKGRDELDRVVAGEQPAGASGPSAEAAVPSTWLSSIGVQGFRGIGPRSSLLLTPGPGLTLVVGRNGSGKSSFAEGLEMLMTGANLRWQDRSAAWQDGWRNLHAGDSPEVSAEFVVEGRSDVVEASRSWGADAALGDNATSVADPAGEWQALDAIGWASSLDKHRPFLSYNELGSMLEERPSDLYDAMSAFLGLDDLLAAQDHLRKARLDHEKPAKDAKAQSKAVVARLHEADDARAAEAAGLMSARKLDVEALRSLADAGAGSDGELERLRAVANLTTPDAEGLAAAADGLDAALTTVTDLAGTAAGRADRLEQLLTAARDHAHDESTETCPVCGTEGVLTAAWHEQTIANLEELKADAESATTATANLDAARRAARTAIEGTPAPLKADDATEAQQAAADAWTAWADVPDTDAELIARLRSFGAVSELVEAAKTEAAQLIEERDLNWRPHARAIGNWLDQHDQAQVASAKSKEIKQAEEQLKAAIATIRDERFAPIADRSRELWGMLRHRSNVQLEAVDLEGANTNRRVELNVTVDGEQSAALGVMSQGELHALALSLFLPRATMDESPFRFVMIDDPVQAMDPARVDGLARVLEQIAQTHQVIVFTHDDRLPESVRRLQIPAEVTEVTRQPGSKVSTRPVQDPVRTAISDAFAVAKTEQMALVAKQKVVPAYCRVAVESAAATVVKRRMLNGGTPHHEVEDTLADGNANLRRLVAHAMFGDPGRGREVNDELKARCHPSATWAMHHCNSGAHGNFDADPLDLARASEKLALWILDGA